MDLERHNSDQDHFAPEWETQGRKAYNCRGLELELGAGSGLCELMSCTTRAEEDGLCPRTPHTCALSDLPRGGLGIAICQSCKSPKP